jgi:cutinase
MRFGPIDPPPQLCAGRRSRPPRRLAGFGGRGVARSPAFAGKAIDLCAAGDPICTKGIQDLQWHSHLQPSYIDSGLVDQAASFVAGKL